MLVAAAGLSLAACENPVAPEPELTLSPDAEAALHIAGSGAAAARIAEAKKCLDGGYLTYTKSDGSTFPTVWHCVGYALLGGELKPVAPAEPPQILGFTLVESDCETNVAYYRADFTGGTGVIDHGIGPVESGQVVALPGGPTYTLTVTSPSGQVATAQSGSGGTGGGGGCTAPI